MHPRVFLQELLHALGLVRREVVGNHVDLPPPRLVSDDLRNTSRKTATSAARIEEQAAQLDAAGCFAIVLECVPAALAARVSKKIRAATIGIGAGAECDGQVSVVNDLLGLSTGYLPRHAKRYANFYADGLNAMRSYVEEVRAGIFPGPEHSIDSPQAEQSEKKAVAPSEPHRT